MNFRQTSFKLSNVAFYVQEKYSRRQKRKKNLGWAGPAMLANALLKEGVVVDNCGPETVEKYKVILVSITSSTDWYSFIAERTQWKTKDSIVIVGGSGVNNIRPFLEYADIFVFGRAEDIIVRLVKAALQDEKIDHDSICYSEDFSAEKKYRINQAQRCYPDEITLGNNRKWIEKAIGCQRKCLFCMYSWHRNRHGKTQDASGSASSLWRNTIESTLFQLNLDMPNTWPEASWMIFGIDGMSERLRRMVNKPITNEMLIRFFRGLPQYKGKTHKIKLYNIVGLPTETNEDWEEFRSLIYSSNNPRVVKNTKTPKVEFHFTPFKASPCTPAATWPVSYKNHRESLVKRLQHDNCKQYQYGMYAGEYVDFNISWGTESLFTVFLWMVAFRGTEKDADLVRQLATDKMFKQGKTMDKIKRAEKLCDIRKFFTTVSWNNLPTKYLQGPIPYPVMQKLSSTLLRKYGGNQGEWISRETEKTNA